MNLDDEGNDEILETPSTDNHYRITINERLCSLVDRNSQQAKESNSNVSGYQKH